MNTQIDRAKEIFLDALEVAPADERRAFLDRACAGDSGLRAEVEALLGHHAQVGSFLATVPRDPDATAGLDVTATEGPGAAIGPYRLLEPLGEGGMGLVFVAEQTDPVRRTVALKVIKPGMDTREVVARFEAERQALALMDHPNIARVLDGGSTPAGRPYFVMELVRGAPITDYCDRSHRSVRDRLGLFVQVCQAVQHAHQKGVIHRDLKPSNVLVTEHDGRPVAKVIDFGVAKAVGAHLTDKTINTRFMQLIGTPLYMSPEQAGISGLDVDTRSDVYSLGVLLYELLTGTTPFDRDRFRHAGYDELRRIIREEEPDRPSTRLSTLQAAVTTVSANRGTDPRRLSRSVRGELDWVVMKALEKDRNRRYETAAAFAADVQRYLADEPVQACPPSATYRLRKFARRNRAAVAAASALTAVLLLAVAGQAVNNHLLFQEQKKTEAALEHATREEEKAKRALADKQVALEGERREKEQKEEQRARAVAAKAEADQNRVQARKAVNEFLHAVATNPQLQGDLNSQRVTLLASAIPFLENFVKQRPDDPDLEAEQARAYEDLGFARSETGDPVRALADFDQSEAIFRRLAAAHAGRPEFRLDLASAQNSRAKVLADLRRFDAAERAQREALDLAEKLAAAVPKEPKYRQLRAMMASNLGVLLKDTDRVKEAVPVLRGAIAIRQELVEGQPKVPLPLLHLAQSWISLGTAYLARREFGPAEDALRNALKVLDHEPLKPTGKAGELVKAVELRAMAFNNLGGVQELTRRPGDAEKSYRESIGLKQWLANMFPSVPRYRYELAGGFNNLGNVLHTLNRWDDAQAAYEQAVRIQERLVGDYRAIPLYAVGLGGTCGNLGHLIGDRGRLAESLTWLDKAVATLEPIHREDARDAKVRDALGKVSQMRATTLSGLARYQQALPDWDRAVELNDGHDRDSLRIKRASNLLNVGEYARAVDDARAVAESPAASAETVFRAACVYAVAAQSGHGGTLQADARAARAVALLREAMVKGYCGPTHLGGHTDLVALRSREDFRHLLADAEGIYREATKQAPNNPVGHYNLGHVLSNRGQRPEALAALRKAVELRPEYAEAHDMLGIVLGDMGDHRGSEAAHRNAAEHYTDKDGLYRALLNLGGALAFQRRQPEAVEVLRRAIDLRPQRPDAHYSLGLALGEQGYLPEAIASFHTAVRCQDDYGQAHGNLGFALKQVGRFREAKAALTRSHDLLPPNHPARPRMRQLIGDCDRLIELDGRLPDVLEAKAEPADAAERVAFAEVCAAKGLFTAAARLYAEAFRAQPELAAGRRYDAARAAAAAGCGWGEDAEGVTDLRRTRLRAQAHDWLVDEVNSWERTLATTQGRARAEKILLLMKRNPDFSGVRDAAGLARLSEGEQARWREFWSDANTLLALVKPKDEGKSPEKK